MYGVKAQLALNIAAMKGVGYYNNDDAMIDYFDRAFYININIGNWEKPYVYTGA